MNNEDYAIVTGINLYQDPQITDLSGAINDANAFIHWLQQPEGGNLPPTNIHLLENEPDGLPDIVRFVDIFTQVLTPPGPDERAGRRLYLFLSGHGVTNDVNEGALFLANTRLGGPIWYVPGRKYADHVRNTSLFEEVILLMDCCREYEENLPAFFPFPSSLDSAASGVNYFYAFATGAGRLAREQKMEDDTIRGNFTRALLEGLTGKARNNQGMVTAFKLKEYLQNRVIELRGNQSQVPQCDFNENLVITRLAPPLTPVVVTLTNPERGFHVLYPGRTVMEVEIQKLSKNQHRLELTGDRNYTLAVPAEEPGRYEKMEPIFVEQEEVHVQL